MALQAILRTGCVLIGMAFAGPALTQTANSQPRPVPNPSQSVAAAPAGPVLRRQPRAADIPSKADGGRNTSLDRESPEDAALNRMIGGICHGC